jgi:Ca-activated chloride channel homolog
LSKSASTMRILFYIFIFSFFHLEFAAAQINKFLAEVGQSNYFDGKFQEAAKNFSSAFDQSPNDASLAYNLANSQYRLGKFGQALQSYNQAAVISQDSKLKQKAYYNAGNASFNLGKLEQAIDSYKKALELNPDDLEAKYNLEFSRDQLKKRQQNQQKKDEQKKSSDKDNKDSEKQNPDKSDSQKKQENNEESKENQDTNSKPNENEDNSNSKNSENEPIEHSQENSEDNQEAEKKENGNQPAGGAPQQDGLSKEQAEQWLLSINENRKKFGQMQAKKLKPNSEYRGKDW